MYMYMYIQCIGGHLSNEDTSARFQVNKDHTFHPLKRGHLFNIHVHVYACWRIEHNKHVYTCTCKCVFFSVFLFISLLLFFSFFSCFFSTLLWSIIMYMYMYMYVIVYMYIHVYTCMCVYTCTCINL